MNTSKKINVNFSSLVGLKAELLRKQTEIKDAKARVKDEPQVKFDKGKTKKNKHKKTEIKVKENYTEIEDVATLRKSRIMLEAKSMLYDTLKKSHGDETHGYLVDFSNKPEDDDESEDEIYKEEDYEDANSDPEDDWVDYEDCFGRTRKCLRRDLPKMREKDNLVKREITKEPPDDRVELVPETIPKETVEKEPEIERMRKKWEEQMERLSNKTDIHYQDVLFDEARAHGVGYYEFSQNEEERLKQQENLAKLRKETEQRQKESMENRDIKREMEFNRLKAATVRKRIRSGLSAELTAEEEKELRARVSARNSNDEISPEENTIPQAIYERSADGDSKPIENENSTCLPVIEDKIKAFGELLGKRPKWHVMSQEEWVYKRRKDRLGEFAPVYENFRRGGYNDVSTRDTTIVQKEKNHQNDPIGVNSTGPEPTDRWESERPSCTSEPMDENTLKKENHESMEQIHETEIKRQINEHQVQRERYESTNEKENEIKEKTDEEENQEEEENREKESIDVDEVIDQIPKSLESNLRTATFINSFVPQPMCTEPSKPVSFDRPLSISSPSVVPPLKALRPMTEPEPRMNKLENNRTSYDSSLSIDFSVPPPSVVPSLEKASMVEFEAKKETDDAIVSSDSDDSMIIGPVPPPTIIGPVPPPTINHFSSQPICGPRLIDNEHINVLSEIPLPPQSAPCPMNNFTTAHFETSKQVENNTGSLNVHKISAGLKYLRQKFDYSDER